MVLILMPMVSFAQWRLKRAVKKAFQEEKYLVVQQLLYQYPQTNIKPKFLYDRGVANYKLNYINRAIRDLVASYKLGNNDREVFWYLARCLQSQKKYTLAINKYKAYLRSNPKEEYKEEAIQSIKDCASGLRLRMNGSYGYVSSFGENINSTGDDTNPHFSVNTKEVFYYNAERSDYKKSIYKGHPLYNSIDIMSEDSIWSNQLECFDQSGAKMIFRKSFKKKLSLVAQEYDSTGLISPYYYNCPADISKGDRDLLLLQDSILLFASNRYGGYGGYDIYSCIKKGKKWSEVKNLGNSINTSADEISPYVCNDGQKIYFSSNRINGLGAYDIYSTTYNENEEKWSVPTNLNSPINSSENDVSFKLSSDGIYGLFSSDRKSSMGGFDIFRAKLNYLETAQHRKRKNIWFSRK